MLPFLYHRVSSSGETDELAGAFCKEHGDDTHGLIPDAEFDRLFDHLADVLRRYGTFTEESDRDADFCGCRYVDQAPHIYTVPRDDVPPATALKAALEAVGSAHRPLAVSFDYYPEGLLVLPPNRVFTTFKPEEFREPQA